MSHIARQFMLKLLGIKTHKIIICIFLSAYSSLFLQIATVAVVYLCFVYSIITFILLHESYKIIM